MENKGKDKRLVVAVVPVNSAVERAVLRGGGARQYEPHSVWTCAARANGEDKNRQNSQKQTFFLHRSRFLLKL